MRFEKYINQFVEYLFIKGYSGNTQYSYKREIIKFIHFLDEHYPRIRELSQITYIVIYDFSSYLAYYRNQKGKPLSAISRKTRLFALKKFFCFLAKADLILKDPTVQLELPKHEWSLPKDIPSQKEVMKLLQIPDMQKPEGIRNKAILELAYSSGIRTTEICMLKINDVDFNEMTVMIMKGKGGKTRLVPIGQYAVIYIKLYLEKARRYFLRGKLHDEGYLFLNARGNPFNKQLINQSIIKPLARKAGIKKRITYYSLRHAVASHLILNKVDIRYVQQLLGHVSLLTTQRYCHLDITDLKKMHSLCHPREKA